HNVGGGIVAPIVGAAFAILGNEHWQSASYIVPACVAVIFALIDDVAGELAKYCLQLKTAIRNIPLNVYLQLAEIADDPLAMKNL
ncbi:hypothetical protein MJM99_31175, partial [Salmonella enterica subsp. enterica serovar Kentucky]|nr:hypothetical protein [Salmonella enterica subsp. enterica serovar Kentucky]